jgi:hypothetical protein
MFRSPITWYLAVLFASLGLLLAIALDALRGRPTDHHHVLARKLAIPGATGDITVQTAEKKQGIVDTSPPPVIQLPALLGLEARTSPAPVVGSINPPTTAIPTPVTRPSAPWSSITVTPSVSGSPNDVSWGELDVKINPNKEASKQNAFAERLKSCLADWDPATHMTKDEWGVTCRRVSPDRGKSLKEASQGIDFEPMDKAPRKGTRGYLPGDGGIDRDVKPH